VPEEASGLRQPRFLIRVFLLLDRLPAKANEPCLSLICFIHLLWSVTSSLFNQSAWQSFSIISLQVFFGVPLGLAPSTSYAIHFFTQSLSSFRNTCPYHRNLFHCSTEIMPSNPRLSLNPLLGILCCGFIPHIHLTILISARLSVTSLSFLTGQVSLPCNILLHTQPLYNLPVTFDDISLLVSSGTQVQKQLWEQYGNSNCF